MGYVEIGFCTQCGFYEMCNNKVDVATFEERIKYGLNVKISVPGPTSSEICQNRYKEHGRIMPLDD